MSVEHDSVAVTERRVVLGLGANLGSRRAALRMALDLLEAPGDVRVEAVSRVWDTAPVGPPQPRYLNAAARIATRLTLPQVLERALAVERCLGRERRERWGARSLDVDLLWADEGSQDPGLIVPHARLEERPFALAPMLDVWPSAPARLYEALAQLGGPPGEGRPFGRAPEGYIEAGGTVAGRGDDLDDAVAAAATLLARSLSTVSAESCRERIVPEVTGTAPDIARATAETVLREASEGFATAAVALERRGDGVRIRLAGEPRPPESFGVLGAARVEQRGDEMWVRLSLSR